MNKEELKSLAEGLVETFHFAGEESVRLIKEGLKILSRQKKDSVLLIAGKGHENYQEVKGKRFPLNDKKILKELISVN